MNVTWQEMAAICTIFVLLLAVVRFVVVKDLKQELSFVQSELSQLQDTYVRNDILNARLQVIDNKLENIITTIKDLSRRMHSDVRS